MKSVVSALCTLLLLILCVEGSVLWSNYLGQYSENEVMTVGSSTVYRGVVYYTHRSATINGGHTVSAVNITDGTLLWTTNATGFWFPPSVSEDYIALASNDIPSTVTVLHRHTGDIVWKRSISQYNATIAVSINTAAVIQGDGVYVGAKMLPDRPPPEIEPVSFIAKFRLSDGKWMWNTTNNLGFNQPIDVGASGLVVNDRFVYVYHQNEGILNKIYALHLDNGTVAWDHIAIYSYGAHISKLNDMMYFPEQDRLVLFEHRLGHSYLAVGSGIFLNATNGSRASPVDVTFDWCDTCGGLPLRIVPGPPGEFFFQTMYDWDFAPNATSNIHRVEIDSANERLFVEQNIHPYTGSTNLGLSWSNDVLITADKTDVVAYDTTSGNTLWKTPYKGANGFHFVAEGNVAVAAISFDGNTLSLVGFKLR